MNSSTANKTAEVDMASLTNAYQSTTLYTTIFLSVSLLWLLVLQPHLRHKRRKHMYKHTYSFPTRASFSSMTSAQAHSIQMVIAELECPFVWEKALQFALFRTYGIPSISSLLLQTSLFSSPETASKRYVDTGVLIGEFVAHEWGGERWREAMARMNCIHAQYQRAGKISDADMLYTLALFAREPIVWVERWEWREYEDVEKCAAGVFWKGVGDAMDISYADLASGREGSDGKGKWTDGLHWLEEVMEWAEDYEKRFMVPSEVNNTVAEQTTALLLWFVPQSLKPFGKKAVAVMMDDRLRRSMLYDDPPALLEMALKGTLNLRKLLIRHVFPPRPNFMRIENFTKEKSKQGTYFSIKYDALPFYIKPTLMNRYGPSSWPGWLLGLPVPGDDGDKYFPNGYKIPETGPSFGKKEQSKMEERVMQSSGARKCPMALG